MEEKMGNLFTDALTKHDALTWNGAVSNSTSGNNVLDYFGKAGSYRGRKPEDISQSMANIFAEDPVLASKAVFYNRMITRKTKGFFESEVVQRGQGQVDEFVKSMAWLEVNNPDLLYHNLWLVPVVGAWNDLWYDGPGSGFYHYVKPEVVYQLIKYGLADEYNRALIAKYLPKIRSRKATKNDRHRRKNAWARGLCRYLGWSEKDYRNFKSNKEHAAHAWQRIACEGRWSELDFNTIPGKALFKLVSGKGKDGRTLIERHNLENKFLEWIKSQGVAKFTGYPYELFKKAKCRERSLIEKYTYDAQFEGLIQLAKKNVDPEVLKRGVFCALDTSGSMGYLGHYGYSSGDTLQPIDVCVGLGIYFSSLLEGSFKDHVIMFSDRSQILKLKGSFCEKVDQVPDNAMGSTNFQSVIDEICRVRRDNPEIPVEDYPEILLVVSDMQFNPVAKPSDWYGYNGGDIERDTKTNYEEAMRKLREVGLPDMTIIWWNVNGAHSTDFPSTIDDPGTVLISGMDGAIVTSILGGQEEVVDEQTGEKRKLNPYEQMVKALDQEVLNQIKV